MKTIFLSLFVIFSTLTMAQEMPPQAPSEMPHPPGMQTGEIVGRIFVVDKGKEVVLKDQNFAVMVFKDGQRVLILDRKTDDKGNLRLKNIFKDPSFVYILGVEYEGKVYVYPEIQLGANESKAQVEFKIGEGSPYLMDELGGDANHEDHPAQGNAPGLGSMPTPADEKTDFSVKGALAKSHQKVAVFLSVLVLLLAVYFYSRDKSAL